MSSNQFRAAQWAGVLAAFAIPVVTGAVVGAPPYRSGESIGRMLVYLLLIAIVAALVSRRLGEKGKASTRIGVALLMVAIGILEGIVVAQDKGKDTEQRLAVASSLERMAATSEQNAKSLRELTDQPPGPVRIVPPETASPAYVLPPNSMAAFMEELSDFLVVMSKEMRDYQADYAKKVTALQLENVLAGQALATASGRSRARSTMRLYDSYVDGAIEFDKKRMTRMNEWLGEHAKNVPSSEMAGFRKGFDQGAAKNAARAASFYKVQRDLVATVNEVVDVIDKAKGSVQLAANGQLLFSDDAALARFNKLMLDVQSLAAREESLQKEMVASQEATAGRLRDLSKSMKK